MSSEATRSNAAKATSVIWHLGPRFPNDDIDLNFEICLKLKRLEAVSRLFLEVDLFFRSSLPIRGICRLQFEEVICCHFVLPFATGMALIPVVYVIISLILMLLPAVICWIWKTPALRHQKSLQWWPYYRILTYKPKRYQNHSDYWKSAKKALIPAWKHAENDLKHVWKFWIISDTPQTASDGYGFLMQGTCNRGWSLPPSPLPVTLKIYTIHFIH